MKLLITGSHGQLGTELMRLGSAHDLLGVDRDELDITNADAVRDAVKTFAPDAVINAAAYTAVDEAESRREVAFAVNRNGPGNLAATCDSAGVPLFHVSTDYVFDGEKQNAYVEDDPAGPLGVYGESKLAGENAVRKACPRHVIVRTSWMFSAHGNNFVKTMLRLGAEREELGIVADQHGCPTSAAELARAMIHVIEYGGVAWGTYHFCQPEATAWHGFAEAIFAAAKQQGMPLRVQSVKPVATAGYSAPAARPANSVMDCSRFKTTFGFKIRPWKESLANVMKELIHPKIRH